MNRISEHDFYSMVFHFWHRNFVPPNSFYTSENLKIKKQKLIMLKSDIWDIYKILPNNWNIGYDSYVRELQPSDLRPLLGNRRQSIWSWTIHSSQLRNMLCHLLRRKDYFQIVYRNRHRWNIPGGNVYQWHLNSHPKLK